MSKIAVIFPGIGYHCDKPLLYYARRIAGENGYDKEVKIEYSFDGGNIKGDAKKMEEAFNSLYKQSCKKLDKIDFSKYDGVLFIAKSIGTAVSVKYAQEHNISCKKVLYTPIEMTFDYDVKGAIAFSGTKDPWVNPDEIIRLSKDCNLPLSVYENTNHSLEMNNTMENLKNLTDVMKKTAEYIE